jgi:sulfatase modifying factor 1
VDNQGLASDSLLRDIPTTDGRKVLGGVALDHKIGQGGMGSVYLGRHLRLNIDVAVKVLLVPRDADQERAEASVKRFMREAQTAASISHQNLIRVMDVNVESDVHFLVMEYVKGESAGDILKRRGSLPEREAVEIVLGAAVGLGEAHMQGVVHRDVKPDNIMIDERGRVKVADLGLAKAVAGDEEDAEGSSLTKSHTAMGTPYYMAPEQFTSSHAVGPAADVWSLGVTLYQLMRGAYPWSDTNVFALAKKIESEPMPDLGADVKGASPGVRAIIARATQKDPSKRYADCRAMGEALSGHLATLGAAPARQDMTTPIAEVPPTVGADGQPLTRTLISKQTSNAFSFGSLPAGQGSGTDTTRDAQKKRRESFRLAFDEGAAAGPAGAGRNGPSLESRAPSQQPQPATDGPAAPASSGPPPSAQSAPDAETPPADAPDTKASRLTKRALIIASVSVAGAALLVVLVLAAISARRAYLVRQRASSDLTHAEALLKEGSYERALEKARAGIAEYGEYGLAGQFAELADTIRARWDEQLAHDHRSAVNQIRALLEEGRVRSALTWAQDEARKAPNAAYRDELTTLVRTIAAQMETSESREGRVSVDDLRAQLEHSATAEVRQAAERILESDRQRKLAASRACEELLVEAQRLRASGSLDRAEEKLVSALGLVPAHGTAKAQLAEVRRAISRRTEYTSQMNQGRAHWGAGAARKAAEAFHMASQSAPEGSEELTAALLLARHARIVADARDKEKGHDIAGAVELYASAKALIDEPVCTEAYQRLMRAIAEQKAVDEARKHIEGGQWKDAADELAKLAETGPANKEVKRLLVQAQRHLPPTPEVGVDLGGVKLTAVYIEPGWSPMGHSRVQYPAEGPSHDVTITKGYYFGKTEVTVAQFTAFMTDTTYMTDPERTGYAVSYRENGARQRETGMSWKNPGFLQGDDHPVVCVSWNDASAFCEWLSTRAFRPCRLPTEAEWESACRARTATEYCWGDDPYAGRGWCNATGVKAGAGLTMFDDYTYTAPVGQFRENALGLYDMHGNVWEWCSDWYGGGYYAISPEKDPQGNPTGTERVLRGGAWNEPVHPALQSAHREKEPPDCASPCCGFRVVIEQ